MDAASNSLAGRIILVTGGARRRGAAISRHLGGRGARVIVHHRSSERAAQALVRELPAGSLAVAGDLALAETPARLLAALRRDEALPDAIVHAAASFVRRPLLETSAADWDAIFALNLRSFFLLAQAFAVERGERGGALVAVGDSGALELWPSYLAHCVAKAALASLVQALAKAMAPRYRVNAVLPGAVLPPDDASPAERDGMAARSLLGRLGDPAHVASAIELLLTDDYITGALLPVNGGSHLWRRDGA